MMRPRCARNGATLNLSSPEQRTSGRATTLMKLATQAFRSGAESLLRRDARFRLVQVPREIVRRSEMMGDYTLRGRLRTSVRVQQLLSPFRSKEARSDQNNMISLLSPTVCLIDL
jgi:hypothetical protein